MGDMENEEKDYRKALELQPNNVNTIYHLASLQEKREFYD